MVNSLTEADIKTRGVPVLDLYLAQEAERMRKRTGAVEKVEEQCHPLNGLNFSQVIFALNQTLLQQESLRAGSLRVPYTTEDLIRHYNCGDLNSIVFNHDTSQVPNFNNVTLPPSEQVTAQEIDAYFRQELIYKRNERMGKRVKALLEEHPDKSFFFAFGAGHFLGNNTVIDVLRLQGYEVEHTPAGQPIRRRSSSKPASPALEDHQDDFTLLEPFLHDIPHKEEDQGVLQEEDPLPHMLLPADSLDLLEKAEKKMLKKKRRNKQKKQQNRHFNDLWVRIEESSMVQSPPPPLVRIINGYITVEPPNRVYSQHNYHHLQSSSPVTSFPYVLLILLFTLIALVFQRGSAVL